MKVRLLPNEQLLLSRLGVVLREERLQRNETQGVFGARLGVSRQTVGKMERGEPGIAIGAWMKALALLGRLEALESLLEPSVDPFEEHDREAERKTRLWRARARQKKGG